MNAPKRSSGMALIEALVASAVLAIGVLGAARLILQTQASLRESRAQAHANILASEALDCALNTSNTCPEISNTVQAGVRYTVSLTRSALGPQLQAVQATVEWVPEGESGSHTPHSLHWYTRVSNLSD